MRRILLLFALLVLVAGLQGQAPRFDRWKIIGPGGGGAQFMPAISPHNVNDVLVRCDMTGAYITHDGGASWRMFHLRQPVDFFVWDPVDPKTIYAHTIGLFRSADGGRTWKLVFPKPEQVARIEMADDHSSETIVTTDNQRPQMTALAVDPADPKVLFAAISENRASAFYVSNDRGGSWQKQADLATSARRIYIDASSPRADRTVYVALSNAVLIRERGQWKQQATPPGVTAFADISGGFAKGAPRPVFYALPNTNRGPVNISTDGGASWRAVPIAPESEAAGARLVAVATSLNHPEVAYVSYSNLGSARAMGVAKTEDTGKTWRLVWKDARTTADNVQDSWIGERFGPGWGENPLNLGVAPNDPNICYGTDLGRTMRTTDGGRTWKAVYSRRAGSGYTTTGLDVTTNYGVHFDPFDRQRMFISYTDIGLFRSEDGGQSWVSATTNGVPRDWTNTTYWVEFDPQVKGRMWAVMTYVHDLPRPKMWRRTGTAGYRGGVMISEDGGRSWSRSGEMPPTAPTHILLDPTSPTSARVLYVAGFGRGVFKSADGGRTWALKNTGIEGADPFAWRLARDRNGALYLVVARRSENGSTGPGDGALYRSTDGAEHWEKIQLPPGLNGPNGISVDPKDPQRLYLAAWARNVPPFGSEGGIWLSTDAGKNWRNVLAKDQHVYDVTIDPGNARTLYACGFESSAWRSSDAGETWQRIRGFNFKWGHRVIPDPYNPAMIYITTFGGSVWYGPAAGDAQASEDIVPPLRDGK